MDECKDLNQMEMNFCTKKNREAADASLKAAYQILFDKYDAKTQKLLAADQVAWEKYRKSHCDFMSSRVEGGSVHPTILAMCQEDMAKEREKALADIMKCAEGDMSCPWLWDTNP